MIQRISQNINRLYRTFQYQFHGRIFYWVMILVLIGLFGVTDRVHGETVERRTFFFFDPGNLQHQIVSDLIGYYNPALHAAGRRQIIAAIFKEAGATGIDPFLITGVIAAESSFRPNAVSPCAAMGLMQLSPGVVKGLRIANPLGIPENINAGTRYLLYLQKRFHRDELALAAYNAGPSRVARLRRVPRIPETIGYIRKINALCRSLADRWTLALRTVLQKPVLCPLLADLSDQPDREKFANLQCRIVSRTLTVTGMPGLTCATLPGITVNHSIFDRRLLLFA